MISQAQDKIRIAVGETSPIVCAGLVTCLRRIQDPDLLVMEAHTYADLCACIVSTRPDMVIVNPGFTPGFLPASLAADTGHPAPVLAICTGHLDKATRALYQGVITITDDMDTIAETIRHILSPAPGKEDTPTAGNRDPLSAREKEIVTNVVRGLTNKEIADKLYLSVHTVVTHRRNIARKLDIHSPTGLTIYAIVNNLVDLSEIKI